MEAALVPYILLAGYALILAIGGTSLMVWYLYKRQSHIPPSFPVQYQPPEGLSPAAVGFLKDRRHKKVHISGLIIGMVHDNLINLQTTYLDEDKKHPLYQFVVPTTQETPEATYANQAFVLRHLEPLYRFPQKDYFQLNVDIAHDRTDSYLGAVIALVIASFTGLLVTFDIAFAFSFTIMAALFILIFSSRILLYNAILYILISVVLAALGIPLESESTIMLTFVIGLCLNSLYATLYNDRIDYVHRATFLEEVQHFFKVIPYYLRVYMDTITYLSIVVILMSLILQLYLLAFLLSITVPILVIIRCLPNAINSFGIGVYIHALGFDRYITEAEKRRIQFHEQDTIDLPLLPYAVALGHSQLWSDTLSYLKPLVGEGAFQSFYKQSLKIKRKESGLFDIFRR